MKRKLSFNSCPHGDNSLPIPPDELESHTNNSFSLHQRLSPLPSFPATISSSVLSSHRHFQPHGSLPISYQDITHCFNSNSLLNSLQNLQSLFHSLPPTGSAAMILTQDLFLSKFNLSFYWLLHLQNILPFNLFIRSIPESTFQYLLQLLWESIPSNPVPPGGNEINGSHGLSDQNQQMISQEIFQAIILFLFNESVDSNSSFTDSIKLMNLIDEFCFSSLPSLSHPHNNLQLTHSSLRGTHLLLSSQDVSKLTLVCSSLLPCLDSEQVQKFHMRVLFRLFSCHYSYATFSSSLMKKNLLEVCSNDSLEEHVTILSNLFSCFGMKTILNTFSLALFHDSKTTTTDSVFDYSHFLTLSQLSNQSTTPFLLLLLPAPAQDFTAHSSSTSSTSTSMGSYSIAKPFLAHCSVESLLETVRTVFEPIQLEDNTAPFLRAVCLLEAIGGSHLVETWLQKSFQCNQEVQFLGTTSLKSSTFIQICLSLCSVIEAMEENTIRSLCQILRSQLLSSYSSTDSKYQICKDSLESFLQIARSHLQQLERRGNAFTLGNDQLYLSKNQTHNILPEVTSTRIVNWATSLQQTSQLPVGLSHLSSLLGRNGYKKIFVTMHSLISSDQSLTNYCEVIVNAMKDHRPPLCPIQEGEEFIGRIKGTNQSSQSAAVEEKIQRLLEYILSSLSDKSRNGTVAESGRGNPVTQFGGNISESKKLRDSMVEVFRHLLSLTEFISSLPSLTPSSGSEEKTKAPEELKTPPREPSMDEMEHWSSRWRSLCLHSVGNLRTVTASENTLKSRFIASINLLILQSIEVIYNKLHLNFSSYWNMNSLWSSLLETQETYESRSSSSSSSSSSFWLLRIAQKILSVYHLNTSSYSQHQQCRDEMICSLVSLINSHFLLPISHPPTTVPGLPVDQSHLQDHALISTLLTSSFCLSLLQDQVCSLSSVSPLASLPSPLHFPPFVFLYTVGEESSLSFHSPDLASH
jgi:hypothetical protein